MRKLVTACLVKVIFLLSVVCQAAEYLPEDLKSPKIHEFDNGLQAILNPRGTAKNVSLRIVVGVGLNDFPCEKREVPHLAEHLLYSGTSQYSEAELEKLVEGWGGIWNATTRERATVYELDIFSANIYEAIDLHYQMLVDTQLDDAKIESARGAVHAESGSAPNAVKAFLDGHGILSNSEIHSYRQFIPESKSFCAHWPSAAGIEHSDIQHVLESFYIPSNITVIVVGDFVETKMLDFLRATFGVLPKSSVLREKEKNVEIQAQPLRYHTTLNPFVSNQSLLSLEFQIPTAIDQERLALSLLASYMSAQLYQRLRTELGWAYTPEATIESYDDFSVFYLSAEVDPRYEDATIAEFESLVAKVRAEGVPSEELEMFKNGFLLSQSAFYEANADYAEFYVNLLYEMDDSGRFPDFDEMAAQIDQATTKQLARKYFVLDKAMYYYQQPTVSYIQLLLLLAFLLLAILISVYFYRQRLIKKA